MSVVTAEEASDSRQLDLPNQEHAKLLQLSNAPALCPRHDLVLHKGSQPYVSQAQLALHACRCENARLNVLQCV